MNFPSRHPLNQTSNSRQLVAGADVILGLELTDFWGTVSTVRDGLTRTSRSIVRPGTKLISITALDLATKGNYQDFQRYPVDVAMAADAEATLPAPVDAPPRDDGTRHTFEAGRGKRLADANASALERARAEAAYAWDARRSAPRE